MLVVDCPGVPSGRQLLSERRVVRMTDDGAGTITLLVACYSGHLHEVVTGWATTSLAATPLRRPASEVVAPVAAAAC